MRSLRLNHRQYNRMYASDLLDGLSRAEHVSEPFPPNGSSSAQEKPKHDASTKHRKAFPRTPLQLWCGPGDNTGILNRDSLGLDGSDLLKLLQEAVVQSPKRLCRAFEVAHRDLRLIVRLHLLQCVGQARGDFVLAHPGHVILVSVGIGDAPFLLADRCPQLLHSLTKSG